MGSKNVAYQSWMIVADDGGASMRKTRSSEGITIRLFAFHEPLRAISVTRMGDVARIAIMTLIITLTA
jgi:hypothetical protein